MGSRADQEAYGYIGRKKAERKKSFLNRRGQEKMPFQGQSTRKGLGFCKFGNGGVLKSGRRSSTTGDGRESFPPIKREEWSVVKVVDRAGIPKKVPGGDKGSGQ